MASERSKRRDFLVLPSHTEYLCFRASSARGVPQELEVQKEKR